MQGTIVQTIGLALAANAYKRGLPLRTFWPASTVFQFCSFVRFVDGKKGGFLHKSHKVLANDPNQWLRECVDRFTGARVHAVARNDPTISDRASVAFVGGGPRWIIELVGSDFSELWEDRWKVVDEHAPDRRIWGVEYLRIADRWAGMPEPQRDLAMLAVELARTLNEIADFAKVHDLAHFAECFERAREALRSDEPLAGIYHSDWSPPDLLTVPAEQLLASAQAAWVFGGMGSWNDIWFEGDATRYEELSDRLFALLTEAAVAATNSSYPTV